MKAVVDRVEQRFGMKPRRLIGDTAYGTAEMLSWMVNEKHIEPHVPVWDRIRRKDGSLSASEFLWDAQANEYRCPEGFALRSDRRHFTQLLDHVTKADPIIYCSSQHDCTGCALIAACMKTRETWGVRSRRRPSTLSQGGSARRWRCPSPT